LLLFCRFLSKIEKESFLPKQSFVKLIPDDPLPVEQLVHDVLDLDVERRHPVGHVLRGMLLAHENARAKDVEDLEPILQITFD
jgi:hypothetical protein